MVVFDGVVVGCTVDDYANSLFNVVEGFEALVQVTDQFGQLLGPGLTDMAFIDDQH